jgi:dolichyldiphosphatase
LAVGWFCVTGLARRWGWVEWGLETRLARSVRMRDLVVMEDVADAGWVRWNTLRRKVKQ